MAKSEWDVVVLGAGAAGLMCAIEAGKRGRRVAVFDHAKAPGEKIRISGGGRCNFTNLHCGPKNFISRNPHFPISALKRFSQHDFIKLVEKHKISYHEKTLGQLFCDGASREIISMLVAELKAAGAKLYLNTPIAGVEKTDGGFRITTANGVHSTKSLVVATGGKSIPKMGATGFGYTLAQQFGLNIIETRPALVPFTLTPEQLAQRQPLAGVAVTAKVACNGARFDEAVLMTHRGMSGPAILQISSYWREGDEVEIDMVPGIALKEDLVSAKTSHPKNAPAVFLSRYLPRSLVQFALDELSIKAERMADLGSPVIQRIEDYFKRHRLKPNGTEGYRTAEVTLGGVDTAELSQKNMESSKVPGLYFVGEVVDVTGHLGGHNFQWAWSSGWAAGQTA